MQDFGHCKNCHFASTPSVFEKVYCAVFTLSQATPFFFIQGSVMSCSLRLDAADALHKQVTLTIGQSTDRQ